MFSVQSVYERKTNLRISCEILEKKKEEKNQIKMLINIL